MSATLPRPRNEEEARHLLLTDYEFYAAHALKIVDKTGQVVPFRYKEPQRRAARILQGQRESGKPQRIVELKARQTGFSTQTQGILIQRTTQIPNHHSRVIAHDTETAGKLFKMGKGMYARLPADIRPPSAYENNSQGRQYLNFGTPAKQLRDRGIFGLDSSYSVATAGRRSGGRGGTERTVHVSEFAWWDTPDIFDGIAQAVPDDPDSLIVVESTANGENHFKDFWDLAAAGDSEYAALFTAWFEEPGYRRVFANDIERQDFEARIGEGPYGADERELIPLVRAYWGEWILDEDALELRVLEVLNWRRHAIKNRTRNSVSLFHQEYPSTPEEAFLTSGRKVFDAAHVARVRKQVERTDPVVPSREQPGPALGLLRPDQEKVVVGRQAGLTLKVPQRAIWVPARAAEGGERSHWRRWASPVKEQTRDDGTFVPAGQYIVACDPMSGEENEGALANHAIQVIDHRTLRQVAEYESRADPDQVALECLMVALFFNRAWIAVEVTGGWGFPIVRRLALDYHYPRVITREDEEARAASWQDRLGWSTDTRTKPQLIARGQELLRNEVDGIRSRTLAQQLGFYVYDERGRSGPQPGKLADVLMAWLIAQEIAGRRPIRPSRARGAISTTGGRATVRAGSGA